MHREGDTIRRVALLCLAIALMGASCKKAPAQTSGTSTEPVTLTMWQLFDQPDAYSKVISEYQKIHPNVTINVVTKPDYETYELDVANGIAANTGPDLWMIRNDWLPKHQDKLQAMPDSLLGGTAKDAKTNVQVVADRYPPTVVTDAEANNKVYGIPLSIDTLALYYNKDQFQAAGIVTPPATWSEFITDVTKLTTYTDATHSQITHAGAAIGGNDYLNRATDILMLIMMQNGTKMVSDDHTSGASALFDGANQKPGGELTYPGTNALDFYTGFADPRKSAFTWQPSIGNDPANGINDSIDAFAQGKVSMIFSYAYLKQTLLQKNPNLNYAVAPMVQPDGAANAVDYPTYWLEVVSRNTKHSAQAWDFMKYLSETGDQYFQAATGKPPAKKVSLIPAPKDRAAAMAGDAGAPWSFQASTAQDWYRGNNTGQVERIFGEMIENVVTFHQPSQSAIANAASQVTSLLRGAVVGGSS